MTDEQRLQLITEQLLIVRDNLFRGLSKSMQKLQAQSINEVLELPNYMQSSKQEQGEPVAEYIGNNPDELDLSKRIGLIHRLTFIPLRSKLYTTPQQPSTIVRTWVGLTTKDQKEIQRQSVYVEGAIRMTEAKLKEKNT